MLKLIGMEGELCSISSGGEGAVFLLPASPLTTNMSVLQCYSMHFVRGLSIMIKPRDITGERQVIEEL